MARAPEPLQSPAQRRSAYLAEALSNMRQEPQEFGGWGGLGARLLAQGLTQYGLNKAEKTVQTEREAADLARRQRLAAAIGGSIEGPPKEAESSRASNPLDGLSRLLRREPAPSAAPPATAPPVAPAGPAPVPAAPMAAGPVEGGPIPPAVNAQAPFAQPAPAMPQVPTAPAMPQAASPPAPAAPANPLGPSEGERQLILQYLNSGDPGLVAQAEQMVQEIQLRAAQPAALRYETQMVNGVPVRIDPTGASPSQAVFADGLPAYARTQDEFNPEGTRGGTLGQRDPTGRLSIIEKPPEGFESAGGRLRPVAGGPQDPAAGGNAITNERDLRKEFEAATAEYRSVRQAYQKVEASLSQGTGIGDVGGIFGVMKVFDPGSTVREGEAATVQSAGGVPEQIRGLYNRVVSGERLTPQQREEIKAVARAQFGTYEEGYQSRVGDFVGMAQQYGLTPSNVVGERQAPVPRTSRTTPARGGGNNGNTLRTRFTAEQAAAELERRRRGR